MTTLPPFLFVPRNQSERRTYARWKAEGTIRKIGPRLFTSLPEGEVEVATRRSWTTIVSELFPHTLVSHRTALEFVPSPDGVVFLTANTNRATEYPGLRIERIRGPAPLSDDPRFLSLRASSRPRAFLENLSRDARRRHVRTLPIEDVEARLEQLLRTGGEIELNGLRDRAREIAEQLGWRAEYARLDALISTLLGTRSPDIVTSDVAKARAVGEPFDPACLERLQLLYAEIGTRSFPDVREPTANPLHTKHKAFFESYFSNYIEGTRFDVEQAEEIIFDRRIPEQRPKDAHDVTGTFDVVSDVDEMRRTPATLEELLELLRTRHRTLLGRRPEAEPGTFKRVPNYAGDTKFVEPQSVVGTLRRGHELYMDLPSGMPRAIFMTFLVADVHPFIDGNGRIARVMMNAELASARLSTIIIPTVFRDDYLQSLRRLSRRHRPDALVNALTKAASFSNLDFSDYPRILAELQRRNWFREPDDARIVTGPL